MATDLTAAVQDLRKKLRLLIGSTVINTTNNLGTLVEDINTLEQQVTDLMNQGVTGSGGNAYTWFIT